MVDVQNVTSIYAKAANRPGSLEHAAKVIGEKRINIDAVSVETVGSEGFLRILTPKPREALEALRSNGIEAHESPVLVVGLQNRPKELANAAGEIAAAGINIEAVLTTPDGKLAFRTSDNDRAAQILRKL